MFIFQCCHRCVQALLQELEEDEQRKAAEALARKAKKERRQDMKKKASNGEHQACMVPAGCMPTSSPLGNGSNAAPGSCSEYLLAYLVALDRATPTTMLADVDA